MAERNNNDPCRVQLKDVILSYPNLFRAKAFGKGEGEPAFSANFLLDKDTKTGKHNIALIEDAIDAAKEAKWNGKPPKIKSDRIFFKDGDSEDYGDAEENHGMMIVTSRNYKKPRTLDRDKQDCVEADDILYGGARVDAIVRVWGQDNDWGVRINCSLEAVRFRKDGDRFGSAPVDPDEFEDLDDEDDEEDEKPSRSRRNRDDEDDKPSRSRRNRDDDEDEKPSRSRRNRDDEEDLPPLENVNESPHRGLLTFTRPDQLEEIASRPSRSRRNRDDEEDEKPSRSRRARDEDDDEDRPSRNSRSRRNHDDV